LSFEGDAGQITKAKGESEEEKIEKERRRKRKEEKESSNKKTLQISLPVYPGTKMPKGSSVLYVKAPTPNC
jgi:hypothetical protein